MFLIRTLHKWFGLILGLQFVLWTISGAMMALLDHHKVSAEHSVREPAALIVPADTLPLARVAEAVGGPILALRLKPLGDGFVYEAATPSGVKLVDATSGRPVAVDAARAGALAAAAFSGSEAVASVRKVDAADVETRKLPLPLWRVEFADAERTTLLLSAATGDVLERRNNSWRLWDVFWMIHIMDYTKRESFNHPLIITVAAGIAWLALSGLILLVQSFRRRDFAWVLDPVERLRGGPKARVRES
ncbi:MAG: PepSY domain-containing protein [Phenylobacterium sp.]|uniref:PepSY domain-containing protein n=1 Tax=Phenylobacterium sp. TaxID=1871053 RepID=UPI00273496AD|nr:PepSY domain-containing protein [Phenylobacterium sp.]MDP3748100.1 PepSY domain-containing protein [Phenylobacterium sp.]